MLIEVCYKNGSKERRLCKPTDTFIGVVQDCEAQRGSKIQSIKVVKREHKNPGNHTG